MRAAVKNPESHDDDSLRVLVVEDLPDSVLLLTRMLEQSGCVVQTTRNGTEALTVANSFAPDAALIDIGLPGLDGLHVARELRKLDENTLLVAITGRSEPKDILNSKEAGFDHHLTKPLDCGKLTAILASYRRMIHAPEAVNSNSHGHLCIPSN